MATKTMTVIDNDAAAEAQKMAKLKRIKSVPECQMTVDYVMDEDLYKKIQKDSGFLARFHDEVRRPGYVALVSELTKILMVVDQKAQVSGVPPIIEEAMRSDMKTALQKYEKLTKVNAEKAMTKYLQISKDKTTYKWDVRVKVGKAAGSLAMSGVSLGLGMVTGGLSIAITAISMAKSMVKLVREYQRTKQDADAAREKLQKTIKHLKSSYSTKSKAGIIFAELGAQGASDFLVFEKVGIKRADTELLTFKGKFAKVHEKSADMGAQLNDLIDTNTKYMKNFEKVIEMFGNDGLADTQLKLLEGDAKRRDKDFKAQFEALVKIQKTITETEQFITKTENTLSDLKSKKPRWVKAAELIISVTELGMNPGLVALTSNGANVVAGWEKTQAAYALIKSNCN